MTDVLTEKVPVARLRLLIVGAGRRVQNNFLPVLACLHDQFEIVGLHSRTADHLLPVAQRWNVQPVMNLSDVCWAGIDVVVISVPTAQNAVVMRQLLALDYRLRLMIDTPIASNLQELAACIPLLSSFKQVLVAEDYMNFPSFALLREAVVGGMIGKPRAASLYNIGYSYHGLALIRSFSEFRPVFRSTRQAAGRFSTNVLYHLRGGFRACVIGPYRQHENGGIILEGDKGVITEVAGDSQFGDCMGRPVYRLTKLSQNGQLSGYEIQDEAGKSLYSRDLPLLSKMRDMPFEDKSNLNMLRGCGLSCIFEAFTDHLNINNKYGARQALYDSFVSRLASRGMLPIDPFLLVNRNVMMALRLVARVRGALH